MSWGFVLVQPVGVEIFKVALQEIVVLARFPRKVDRYAMYLDIELGKQVEPNDACSRCAGLGNIANVKTHIFDSLVTHPEDVNAGYSFAEQLVVVARRLDFLVVRKKLKTELFGGLRGKDG